MGKRYQGTAVIRVNGQEYETLEGATFTASGFERSTVTGARVYGFKRKPKESTLDAKFVAGGALSVDDINGWEDVTIEFTADTGESHMMAGAWTAEPASNTDGGEISAKFAAVESKRIA